MINLFFLFAFLMLPSHSSPQKRKMYFTRIAIVLLWARIAFFIHCLQLYSTLRHIFVKVFEFVANAFEVWHIRVLLFVVCFVRSLSLTSAIDCWFRVFVNWFSCSNYLLDFRCISGKHLFMDVSGLDQRKQLFIAFLFWY